MPASLIGILATGIVALVIGAATSAQDDRGGRAGVDRICNRAMEAVARLPHNEEPVARVAAMASLLRSTASALRSEGLDELAWAFQTWAAADDDMRRSLRTRGTGSPRAGAAAWVARTDTATAAGALGAQRCVQLARRG